MPTPIPMPPKPQLEQAYLIDGMSLVALGEKFGVSDVTAKKWLKLCGIQIRSKTEQEAVAKQKYEAQVQAAISVVVPEIVDEGESDRVAGAIDNSGAAIVSLPASAKASASMLDAWDDEDDGSAFSRLTKRMQNAVLIYSDVDNIDLTDGQKAEKIGIDPATLSQWKKDADFQDAVLELMDRNARFNIKANMRADLMRLSKTHMNAKDREIVLRWLGELGPDTQINFNQVTVRGKDPRIQGF